MLNLSILTALPVRSTVINMAILGLSSVSLVLMRTAISRTHGKMFILSQQDLSRAHVHHLAPYIALRHIV